MAKLNKEALKIQKEFLPIGTEIAKLRYKLLMIGAFETMRILDRAAEVFYEDVTRIVQKRNKKTVDR